MSALRLRRLLRKHRVEVKALARACALSSPAASRLVNHGAFPARRDSRALRAQITEFLASRGITARDWHQQEKAATRSNASRPDVPPAVKPEEIDAMVLRKVRINEAARQCFNITRDPFGEPQTPEDVFLSPSIRYVREAVLDKAKHGGMLAVIGQSGSGKTTIRGDVHELLRESNVLIIEPYVIGMEETESRGVPMRAQHIASAIARTVSPSFAMSGDWDTRASQIHNMLRESSRAGNRHVIVVEEGHSLPKPTLRHLRRYTELRDGLRSLLGVVLIGQQELFNKLSDSDPNVREVVQRMELVHMHPLGTDLEPFIRFRFARAGIDHSKLLDAAAIDAVRTRLSDSGTTSMLYPQAVQNLLAMALNAAAELGAPSVSADVVKRVS